MIDVTKEAVFPLAMISSEIRNRDGGLGINVCTTWRWCLKGLHDEVLESVMVGGTRMTSREAVSRFFAAVTAAKAAGRRDRGTVRASREQAASAAEESLNQMGF